MARYASQKKPSSSSKRKPVHKQPVRKSSPLLTEVKYLCLAAVGVLLFLSVYTAGMTGVVGTFFKNISVGILGFGAYLLPFAIVGMSAYALFSSEKQVPRAVLISGGLLCWFITAWLHIFNIKEPTAVNDVIAYLGSLYNGGAMNNGGLLGGLLGNLLRSLMGAPGTYIVLTVGAVITLTLLTGRSFVRLIISIVTRLRGYIETAREEITARERDDPPNVIQMRPERSKQRNPVPAEEPAPAPRRSEKKRPSLFTINSKAKGDGRTLLVSEELASLPPRNTHPILTPRGDSKHKTAAVIPIREEMHEPDLSEIAAPEIGFPKLTPAEDEAPEPELPDELYEDDGADDTAAPPFDTGETTIEFKGLLADAPPKPEAEHPFKLEPVSRSSRAPLPVPSNPVYEHYEYPSIEILTKNTAIIPTATSRMHILNNSRILEETLKSFRIEAKVVEVSVGPPVTRYDMAPGPGVKVSAIVNLSNDLALSLAARGIRIEAPIPGKAAVGIEIPNKEPQPVLLREIIEDDAFCKFPSRLAFAVGKDIAGAPVVTDVARMPHLLIAGATGSGKSVCINTLIASLLYKSRPDEVKLLMVDPKVVELSVYNGIPHLLIPVVTDPKKASGALSWAVGEMEKRYLQFAEAGVRDLRGYNNYLSEIEEEQLLPQIVIIIDELADLMMACKGEVEESICRLAQKARAAGIHLIVATQRPSVDVITGLIKANIPSRLAFAVSSGTDSRTVLDMYGAEKLLGKGDMLFLPMGQSKPIRLQGGFISEKEVEELVDFLKQQTFEAPSVEMIEKVTAASPMTDEDVDEFFHEAVEFLLQKGKASTSMLQRQFRIGYNRASRLMEELETRGIVGPEDGVKPRKVLITREEYITGYE
jgi:S-DNA-T family DNA segregation ATPase FtsK/SpoIIIE